MVIVWPCPLAPEGYAAAGRQVVVPAQRCPRCGQRLLGWGGYWRWVRPLRGAEQRLWIRRGWCRRCRQTQALLPAFLFARRLDSAHAIGLALVLATRGVGLRPIAVRLALPHTTVRAWWRRCRARAPTLLPPLLALATALDPTPVALVSDGATAVLAALGAAWQRARRRAGDRVPDRWRVASLVSGGWFLAAHTSPP